MSAKSVLIKINGGLSLLEIFRRLQGRSPCDASFHGRKTAVAVGSLDFIASPKAMDGEDSRETLDD